MFRLAKKHPGGQFYLFEAVAVARHARAIFDGEVKKVVFIDPEEG